MSSELMRPEGLPPARLPSRLDQRVRPVRFVTLVRAEVLKATDTRSGRWLLATIVILVVLAHVLVSFAAQGDGGGFRDYYDAGLLPLGLFLPIVGILCVTTEWSHRTALTTFSLESSRVRVGLAKWVASLFLGAVVMAATALVSTAAGVLGPSTGTGDEWAVPWHFLAGAVIGQGVALSMGVAFALLLQNTPAAIVGYFILPQVWSSLSQISALRGVGAWLSTESTVPPLMDGSLGGKEWSQLLASVLVCVVIPMVLGLVRLQRSEVT